MEIFLKQNIDEIIFLKTKFQSENFRKTFMLTEKQNFEKIY